METVTIRVFPVDLKEWKRKANLRGLNVSEWIRRQCNEAQTTSEQVNGDGSTDNQNVPGLAADYIPARSPRVSERRGTRRGRGRLRDIEDTTNQVLRTRPAVLPASGVAGVDVQSAAVTRENFAEVMATVKPDEIDSWARSLPSEVLPAHHGAAASKNKCVCRHCLDKRKTLGIWYGYEPKGKKK